MLFLDGEKAKDICYGGETVSTIWSDGACIYRRVKAEPVAGPYFSVKMNARKPTSSSNKLYFWIDFDESRKWDGALEYSFDRENWTAVEKTSDIGFKLDFDDCPKDEIYIEKIILYLRGTGNTRLGGARITTRGEIYAYPYNPEFTCKGNIEVLLDYKTVEAGRHPPMGVEAFKNLLSGSSQLTGASLQFPDVVTEGCYEGLFAGSRILWPCVMKAKKLAPRCYKNMYHQVVGGSFGRNLSGETIGLSATEFAESCYEGMLGTVIKKRSGGSFFTTYVWDYRYEGVLYAIPAGDYPENCFRNMYWKCLYLRETPGEYNGINHTKPFRIPYTGVGTGPESATAGMFSGGAEELEELDAGYVYSPKLNTTYYVPKDVLIVLPDGTQV